MPCWARPAWATSASTSPTAIHNWQAATAARCCGRRRGAWRDAAGGWRTLTPRSSAGRRGWLPTRRGWPPTSPSTSASIRKASTSRRRPPSASDSPAAAKASPRRRWCCLPAPATPVADRGAPGAGQRRVFFALWPDERIAADLALAARAAAKGCGGRQTRKDTVHMTLAFIGGVTESQVAELQAIAGQVQGSAFEMTLDELAWWRHNRIVWAGAALVPPALQQLVSDLHAGLRQAGYRL